MGDDIRARALRAAAREARKAEAERKAQELAEKRRHDQALRFLQDDIKTWAGNSASLSPPPDYTPGADPTANFTLEGVEGLTFQTFRALGKGPHLVRNINYHILIKTVADLGRAIQLHESGAPTPHIGYDPNAPNWGW